jgi:hypothetical protein
MDFNFSVRRSYARVKNAGDAHAQPLQPRMSLQYVGKFKLF